MMSHAPGKGSRGFLQKGSGGGVDHPSISRSNAPVVRLRWIDRDLVALAVD
jgi:hypothetical protein